MSTNVKTVMTQLVRLPLDHIPYLRKGLSRLLPASITERLTYSLMAGRSDRIYLERTLLPYLAALQDHRILFIGCKPYTRHYGQFFANGSAELWTTDIDPECEKWGEPGRHVVADVTEIDQHFEPDHFDVVMLNGIFGYGVDTPEARDATGSAIQKILKPDGTLIVGWSPNPPGQDPDKVESICTLFKPGTPLELSDTIVVSGSEHVFYCYTAL